MRFSKKIIVKYLKDKLNNFEEVDEVLIDRYVNVVKLIQSIEKQLTTDKIVVDVTADKSGVYQVSQLFGAYNTLLKQLINLSRKLGLSARDRKELNIDFSLTNDDGFDA